MARLIFSTSDHWISRVVRFLSRSSVSHVAVATEDGRLFQSTLWDGVHETTLLAHLCCERRYGFVSVPIELSDEEVVRRAHLAIGKKYGWGWLVGRRHAGWYCTNLACYLVDLPVRVSPASLLRDQKSVRTDYDFRAVRARMK